MTYPATFILILSVPMIFRTIRFALVWASCNRQLPASVADIYSPEVYEKWISFRKKDSRFHLFSSLANTLLYIITGIATFSMSWLMQIRIPASILMLILPPAVLCVIMRIITVPLHYYDEMVLKKNYGLCKKSKADFWKDEVMLTLLMFFTAVLESCLLFLCFFKTADDRTIVLLNEASVIPLALGGVCLSLLLNLVCPIVRGIVDKPVPLCDSNLKKRLEALSAQLGFRGKITVAKKTDADSINAYYTPIGNQIVLYRGLVERLSADEICGVVAHEIGHAKHGDIIWNLIASSTLAIIGSFAFWIQLKYALAHQIPDQNAMIPFSTAMLLFFSMFLFVPISLAIRCLQSRLSEYSADRTAVESGNGKNLISALKTSARMDFEDLTPHPLLTALYEMHPPLYRRIEKIQVLEQKREKA